MELVDLNKEAITKPPILAHLIADEIQILIDHHDTLPVD